MEIKSLERTDFGTIFKAFNLAFANYEVRINERELEAMLKRRGFNPDLSFAAFEKDDIVSFTLNGAGRFGGILTAYDTGTGTIEKFRGKGLASEIFEFSIPHLRKAGVKQYLLEVLRHNAAAVSVYRNLGFEAIRELNYFIQENERINTETIQTDQRYSIRLIDIFSFLSVSELWDFHPSWQNTFESIERAKDGFISYGVFAEDRIVGYCIFEPESGDITHIAVAKEHRRRGIATLLLKEILQHNRNSYVKAINTDVLCSSITGFMKYVNIELKGMQFEMIRNIR